MNKYDEFKAGMIGKIVDDGKGGYKGQCVSLIKRWIAFNNWPYKHGNAIDWQKNGDDFYKWIPNSPTGFPVQGDIIVLKVGTYGDVAIVESANVRTYDALGQNYPKGNLTDPVQVRRANYTKPPVVGWLHHDMPVTTPPTPTVDPKDARIKELETEVARLNSIQPITVEKIVPDPATVQKLKDALDDLDVANKSIQLDQVTIDELKKQIPAPVKPPITPITPLPTGSDWGIKPVQVKDSLLERIFKWIDERIK